MKSVGRLRVRRLRRVWERAVMVEKKELVEWCS